MLYILILYYKHDKYVVYVIYMFKQICITNF